MVFIVSIMTMVEDTLGLQGAIPLQERRDAMGWVEDTLGLQGAIPKLGWRIGSAAVEDTLGMQGTPLGSKRLHQRQNHGERFTC